MIGRRDSAERAPSSLLAVCIAAMAMGPVFNFGVSALAPEIVVAYGISEGAFGLVMTGLFVAAGSSAAFLGMLADRIPVRAQLAVIHLGTALAFVIAALGGSYGWLVVAAVVSGIAQAQSNPVTNRVVAERVPRRQRSSWMGWKQSGVQMALLAAGVSFPLVAQPLGWTGAAWFGALLCLPVLAFSWITATRHLAGPRPAEPANPPGRPAPASPAPLRPASGPPLGLALVLFPLASFLNAAGTQGMNAYASLFAVRSLDLPLTVAGWLLAVIGLLGILARIGWGRLAGRLDRPALHLGIMSAGGVIVMLLLTAAEQLGSSALLWLAVPFHAALPLAANVVINSGLVASVPVERIGLASGLVATGMYLGFALGPLVVGGLVDATGGYTPGWLAMAGTYLACGGVAVALGRLGAARSSRGR